MMFDVDPTFPRSQRFLISNNDDYEEESDDDVKVEFSSVRKSHLQFLIRCSLSSSPYLNNSLSVAAPNYLAVNSLQFVIFLDFNRSVDSSQSQMLLDI
jgi:hypothetical protein